jgi:thiol:disulfide interchange protein
VALAVQELQTVSVVLQSLTLVVAVVAVRTLEALVVLVAVVLALVVLTQVAQEQQTLVVVVVVMVILVALVAVQVVLELSLFDMQIHTQPHHQQLAHQLSRSQVDTEYITGQDQGVSHSDGTLCTTQRTKHSHASYCRGKSRTAFGRH